jgi:HNH endonuclease
MNAKGNEYADLEARLASMKQRPLNPDYLYHAITLTADDDLRVEFGTHSQWTGWTEDGRHEIRQSRLVYADYVQIFEMLKQPYCFVLSPDELTVFLVAGGNALVERKLAEGVFPGLLGPGPSIPDGRAGYKSPELFDKTAFSRAPTPRLRMQIFKRDDRRCRICGRRPDDNIDLVLHVHHIRPWEKGGVTDPANL